MYVHEKEEYELFDPKQNRISESTTCSGLDQRDSVSIDSTFSSIDGFRKKIENVWDAYVEQPHITNEMLRKVVDWLFGIFWRRDMDSESIFLCLGLMRVYLKNRTIQKSKLQALALASLLISSKYLEVKRVSMDDLLLYCQGILSRDDIVEMQSNILVIVDFDLELPTLDKYLQTHKCSNRLSLQEQSRVSFWLESAILYDLLSDTPQKQFFLDLILFVTDHSKRSKSIESLVLFTQSMTYKYILNRHKSLFDVQEYLASLQ